MACNTLVLQVGAIFEKVVELHLPAEIRKAVTRESTDGVSLLREADSQGEQNTVDLVVLEH